MKESMASAWRICHSYRRAGFVACSHAALRLILVPVEALREVLSEVKGEVLSIGAGIGAIEYFLADRLPELSFMCSDNQTRRIDVAQRAVQLSRVRFTAADATAISGNSIYSAALAVDVLHHIDRDKHATAVEGLVEAVQPDGLIIIKDIALTPPWKHMWNRIHDRLVSGDDPACREPEEVAAMLEEAGCLVEQCCRLHPYSPYPHYLVVARKYSNELRHGTVLN
jgi:cyclopropane fatty-acyl-phospholipid synthase-like methyltransferase